MTLEEMYVRLGGSYTDARSRLMNDRLIERFTQKYLQDPSYAELSRAVEAGDIQTAFRAAHTLKGVAANLAFERLRLAASALTEQLRPLTEAPDAELFAEVERCQQETVAILETYAAEK